MPAVLGFEEKMQSEPPCPASLPQGTGYEHVAALNAARHSAPPHCSRPCAAPAPANAEPRHAIAMHGEPAMPRDFGVSLRQSRRAERRPLVQGVLGTFDSLNPLIVKGLPAHGLRAPPGNIRGYVIEGLMARGYRRTVHALWPDRRNRSRPTRRAAT